VAEWQTRTTQNRVSKGVRVQVPPPAQKKRPLFSSGRKSFILSSAVFWQTSTSLAFLFGAKNRAC
jgi:hypothetical protein